MKNKILLTVILILPFALFFYFRLHPVREKKFSGAEGKTAQDIAASNALAHQSPQTVAVIASNFARAQTPPGSLFSAAASLAPAGQPAPLEFTNFSPAIVLENMGRAIRQYGAMFGGNPVGDNAEITRQLTGDNPKHVNFLKAEAGMRVNENGELVDAWGTPYFFHQLSGTDMEIHSAGPDKKMWTDDDLVAR